MIAIAGIILAGIALCVSIFAIFFALYSIIEVKAFKQSTHKVEYVPMGFEDIKQQPKVQDEPSNFDAFNEKFKQELQDEEFQELI